MPAGRCILLCALAAAAAGSGCVTERITAEDVAVAESRLVVTRSGSRVNLSWDSEPDVFYTVLVANRRDARSGWQPLRNAMSLRGTGATMTLQDEAMPGEERQYRLQMTPIHAR